MWRAGTASGELETTLTAVHPYAQWSSGKTTIWALGGFGRGSRRFQLGTALDALDVAAGSPVQIEFSGERYRRQTGETDLRCNLLGVVAFGGRRLPASDPLDAQLAGRR